MAKKSKNPNQNNSPVSANSLSQPRTPQTSQPPGLRTVETHVETFSGPIPNPALLKEYENILPGSAERIIRMAEQQAAHRQLLERTVIIGDSKRANRGLWVGGVIAFAFLVGAVFLIYNGHDWAGATLGTVDVASIVGVFIYGTISRKSERSQKAQDTRSR